MCKFNDDGKCYCTESKMKLGYPSERYCLKCPYNTENLTNERVLDESNIIYHSSNFNAEIDEFKKGKK